MQEGNNRKQKGILVIVLIFPHQTSKFAWNSAFKFEDLQLQEMIIIWSW